MLRAPPPGAGQQQKIGRIDAPWCFENHGTTDNDGWEYSTAKHVDDPRERPHWKAEAFTRARVRRRVWYQVAVDPDVFGGEGAPSAKYGATVPIERLIA